MSKTTFVLYWVLITAGWFTAINLTLSGNWWQCAVVALLSGALQLMSPQGWKDKRN